jgi:hypothetical protein
MSPTPAELEWTTQRLIRGNSVAVPEKQKSFPLNPGVEAQPLPKNEAFLPGH